MNCSSLEATSFSQSAMASPVPVVSTLAYIAYAIKKSMDMPRCDRSADNHTLRTLQSLSADYERFVNTEGNPSNVKQFNNVLRSVILPIPVANVVIPVLHLDLGIFPWLFEACLSEVRLLDLKLVASTASSPEDNAAYSELAGLHVQLRQSVREISESQDKLATMTQYLQAVTLRAADRPELEVAAEVIQHDLTDMQQHHNSLLEAMKKNM